MPASTLDDQPVTISAIPADLTDASRLRIDKERHEVTQALSNTKFGDKYTWKVAPDCRIQGITSALSEHKPNILYITGHGSPGIEDEYPVSTKRLATLLKDEKSVDLVYMVACDSGAQAQPMADAVDHIIELEGAGAAADENAISFSREFFTALGDGRSYETAFNRGKTAIRGRSLIARFFMKKYKSFA